MVLDQFILSLVVCKSKFTHFYRLTVVCRIWPLETLEIKEKVQDIDRMNEVYEGVSYIALGLKIRLFIDSYLKIHWKIEVVVFSKVFIVDHFK